MNYKTIVSIICLFALVMGINLFVGSVDAFPQKQLPSQAQGPDVEKIKEQLDTIIERMNDLPEQARAQERVKELRRRLEEYRSLIEGIEIAPLNWCYDFNNDLGVGDTGDDVKALHDALREEGFSTPSDEESFNLLTASSVVGFQQKYEEEILHPLDFSYGTGFVCSSTREKLNEIYGCQEEAEPTCEEGVEKAQEYAEDKICTTEAATMECPTEDDYTYDAVNGCEISFLEDIDWERLSELDDKNE